MSDKVVSLIIAGGQYAGHFGDLGAERIEPVGSLLEEWECLELCKGSHVSVCSFHLQFSQFAYLFIGHIQTLFPFRIEFFQIFDIFDLHVRINQMLGLEHLRNDFFPHLLFYFFRLA